MCCYERKDHSRNPGTRVGLPDVVRQRPPFALHLYGCAYPNTLQQQCQRWAALHIPDVGVRAHRFGMGIAVTRVCGAREAVFHLVCVQLHLGGFLAARAATTSPGWLCTVASTLHPAHALSLLTVLNHSRQVLNHRGQVLGPIAVASIAQPLSVGQPGCNNLVAPRPLLPQHSGTASVCHATSCATHTSATHLRANNPQHAPTTHNM